MEGKGLREVRNFKYLGLLIASTENDIKARKGKAWKMLNDMKKIWSSNMSREIKMSFFNTTVESILLHGSETWTMTPTITKSLNGCYTRMFPGKATLPMRNFMETCMERQGLSYVLTWKFTTPRLRK